MSTANRYQHIKSTKPVVGKARKLKDLMIKSDNRICADCGAPDPKWASANIGVFLCLKCGDVHKALGPDISKVLSVTLDDWSDSDIDSMVEVGGNSHANSIYEAFLPKDRPKPKPDSTMEYRTKFIRLCEGGELLDRILSRGGRYNEGDVKIIVEQILKVVAFCHLQGVVHRDLKLEVCDLQGVAAPAAVSVPEGKSAKKGKRNAEDEIEKAVSAKKQKTVPEKAMPVKKQPPPKKVESSSSEEDSSDSEVEEFVFINGAKRLEGKRPDIFVVNSFGSGFQVRQ
ncbi:ADP-ribosylation factor GTPase-activating protein AGD12 [Zea mays]|uniref:ADP-ribosylation factor GTPase-activating protein AGD12 n=1 Tax=Zea mays TaxID=4577 RepID=A0A3L6E9G3_MAIZE|nr:ADP-ribosylation factor GTPase-activating protein AGD12 [Zea mays]